MTKKLVRLTRRQRSGLGPWRVKRSNEHDSILDPDFPAEKRQHDQDRAERPGTANSIRTHNEDCEKAENAAWVEEWINAQQVQREKSTEDDVVEDADCDESSSSSGCVPSPPPTPPPTLPPRPARHPPDSSSAIASSRQALLQQIRDVGLHARAHETSLQGSNPRTNVHESVSNGLDITHDTNTGNLQQPDNISTPSKPDTFPVAHPVEPITLPPPFETPRQNHNKSAPPIPPKPRSWSRPPATNLPPSPPSTPPNDSPPTSPALNIVVTTTQPPPSPPPSTIAPTPPGFRTFTSSCTRHTVSARLLDWKGGRVWLLKANGVRIAVPLSKFSDRDVEFILLEMARRNDEGERMTSAKAEREKKKIGAEGKKEREKEGDRRSSERSSDTEREGGILTAEKGEVKGGMPIGVN